MSPSFLGAFSAISSDLYVCTYVRLGASTPPRLAALQFPQVWTLAVVFSTDCTCISLMYSYRATQGPDLSCIQFYTSIVQSVTIQTSKNWAYVRKKKVTYST